MADSPLEVSFLVRRYVEAVLDTCLTPGGKANDLVPGYKRQH